MLDRLAADVIGMQYALASEHDADALRELCRAAALLAAFTALTLGNLGRLNEARRWWRSARRVADVCGDMQTVLWVRGHEVVRALFEGRPPRTVVQLAEEAEALGVGASPTALPRLMAGKAQALAMLSRADEAEAALRQLRDIFAVLPAEALRDDKPLTNTRESRLRFTETFVYAHLGETERAEQAQQQALALYPASYTHGPVQVALLQALCQVRSGDSVGGVRQALAAMTPLSATDRIRPVVALGYQVLSAVPVPDQRRAAVAELRDYLARPAGL